MVFSKRERQNFIESLKTEEMDILIIGGGITGAGAALQAAASGMKAALIEMQDFSEGTSSRSTKLVHGGIRYLKNFDVEVVADTVAERAAVQRIAPHIPKPDPMLLPIYEGEGATTFNMFSVKVAMDLYDSLAGVTGTPYENYLLEPAEVLEREPFIKSEGLLGAGVYLDFKNNDARLVIDNIKKAVEDGAKAVSKLKAIGFLYEGEKIIGVKARDLLNGETLEIRAKYVVNTSGPWVDKIRSLNFNRPVKPMMRPTKGVHLVVDAKKLPVPQPTYFDTGKGDGRMVFAIPRENKTYFGTTDTDYSGDYSNPQVTQEDVDYLLQVINYRYPKANIGLSDIEASWAGLRPLLSQNSSSDYNGGNNGALTDKSFDLLVQTVLDFKEKTASRQDVEDILNRLEKTNQEIKLSPSSVSRGSHLEREADGLITLSGGKITDYRKMAEGAIRLVRELLKKEHHLDFNLVDSTVYSISGGEFEPTEVEQTAAANAKVGIDAGLSEEEALYIADFYGMNSLKIFAYAKTMVAYENLSLVESARLLYSLEEEMVLGPADYFVRRTNHLLFGRDRLASLTLPIIYAMKDYFEWSEEETNHEIESFEKIVLESDLAYLKVK